MSEQENERDKAAREVEAEAQNPEQGVTETLDADQGVPADEVASEDLIGEAEVDPSGRIAELEERLAEAEKALSEADLRAQAEIQNMRRRMERDLANAHKYALEKFSGDVLAVADSLERGLNALSPEDDALKPAREGLELTRKVLLDVFAKHGVEQLDPTGQTFDPQQHEAMAMVPAPGAAPNSVIETLEKGYTLNGRLLRPARVVVARAEG